MKYLERLSLKAEAKDAAANELAAKQAKLAVEIEISKLKGSAATIEAAIDSELGKKPFSVNSVIDLTEEAAKIAARQAAAEKVLTELF